MKKVIVPYEGDVCCVEVPDGNIVVRRNNKVAITGNCHKASSSTWKYVLRHMHRAYYRYGLSGTPLTEDSIRNMFLVGFIGRIIQKISNQYLIVNGYSAKPLINVVKREKERIPASLDYAEVYRIGIVENAQRNAQVTKLIKNHNGQSILVMVKHLEHGKIIRSTLQKEEGYFVSGQDTKADRISIYNKFKDRRIPIVIATMIYKEGIDISAIDVLIYAAGEKAPVTILQVLGRGLRARKDKKTLIYYDFEDKDHRHLTHHTNLRIKIYKKEGFLIEYLRDVY
jgi:superfamily II DNA or RNA helicase